MWNTIFGRKRDRDMPISNRVRFIRWQLKRQFLELHPNTKFPLEIYHPDK